MTTNPFQTTIRVVLGDRFGRVLTEIQPDIGRISWRLNDVGKVSFLLRTADPKATEHNLRFGNRIYIDFDNGLPAWGGVIDVPRSWGAGVVRVNAYSGEYILSHRQTVKERKFESQTAGEIFKALILEANLQEDTGIVPNDIWTGGAAYSMSFHYANLLTAIRDELCKKLSGAEFAILPQLADGRIYFAADFYEDRGRTLQNVVLIEGHNTANESLIEQGPIVNWVQAAGSGNSWGDDRLTSQVLDPDSIAIYGLRQGSGVFGEIDIQSTLDAQAATILDDLKDPQDVITIASQNREPALFADYDIGDQVRVLLNSYGFGGLYKTVRIHTREYDPGSGLCDLVVEAGSDVPSPVEDEVPAAFSPTDLSGLVAWYDFSDISTLYQDSAKTTPVTSDADPIGAVVDKSGNGNDVTQGTTAAKPTYKTAIQNSLSAGLGDGGDYLASGAFTEATQPTTLFLVVKNPAIASFETITDGISGTKRHLVQPQSSGSTLRVNAGTSLDTASGATTSTALYAIVFNGSSSIVRKDGSQINTGNAGTQGITGVTLFADNGGSANFTGYIMEYLLYDAEITGTDLSNIENYLNDKWAVY